MAEISDLSVTDANNTTRWAENQNPSTVNDGARALEGILARWARDWGDGFVTTAGSSTAYTAASNRTLSAYHDGLSLVLELHTACGATPTLNVDSVGAQSLVWQDGTALAANDLAAGMCMVVCDVDNTNWVVLSSAGPRVAGPGSSTDDAIARFNGTGGKTLQNSGWTINDAGVMSSGGTLNMSDQVMQRPKLQDYGETVNAIGAIGGGTQDIDLEDGNVVSATVDTSETTFTFSNPPASGVEGGFKLYLTNGGSQTVNWPASVDWASGSAPSLASSGVDILVFTTIDGGTIWYGFVAGLEMQ